MAVDRRPEPITLHCRGLRLQGLRYAPSQPGATRILALHGWLDNANSFARLAPLLDNSEVVAMDLPGHGLSMHRSRDAHYHFIDWVDDVMDIAAALQWQRFVLMGHSMGAGIATLVAGAYPRAVAQLILLDGLGPLSGAVDEVPARLAQHRTQEARLSAREPPCYPSVEALAEVLCKVVQNLSLPSAHLLLARNTQPMGTGVCSRNDPRLRATSLFMLSEAQVRSFLRRIVCPTLLIQAVDGYPCCATLLRDRLALIAHHCHVRLAGGHHLHLESPQTVAPRVMDFLAASHGDGARRPPAASAATGAD